MRLIILIIICCFSLQIVAQEQQLAYQYFRNGEYEKAASIYKKLQEKNPYNTSYTNYLIDCYQLLEEFETAEKLMYSQLNKLPNQEYLYVDLGYNLELQYKNELAIPFYEKALNAIDEKPTIGYSVGRTFQGNHLLDYALVAYKKTMQLNPSANYNFQIAAIYGEKADIPNMFNTYLDMIERDEAYLPRAKNYMGSFLSDDPENEHNVSLKKLLLKRSQNNPKNSWNQLLSWLFLQQKEYLKAFIQEKAVYKRVSEDLNPIIEVGRIAYENKDFEVSKSCFNYVLENTNDVEVELTAKLYLLQISMDSDTELTEIEAQFQEIFVQYGTSIATLNIQVTHAEFVAFKKNEPKKAISELKKILKLPLNEFQNGYVKTKLADILVFTNQFSTALIYYTQVQNSLKNHEIGQTARFKIAQTSYFKGDFEWAQSQLKVLKNSTSQLISNDALGLNLLITDNVVKDSLRVALQKYATAELLAYQHKNKQAIDTLQVVLDNYKEHSIVDEALFLQATLFEKTANFTKAETNYLAIIELNKDDILVDNAIYNLAELYVNKLNDTEKAIIYYQLIIFEYPSSIFLVDARKKFRNLRGDNIN
ncbi:Tetratricopeptide repeat-containing protein [Lutibacter agarilyticus]|uniref:Tetratricopeptide repeat-containing protein n=1 Tax=Lutibacter agarilyticus TaxID=1109740 RepID=A0A238VU78_9FLAO|nr:tetratricopeptide repeat protein [Lutibacter agarilyticus]SNR37798.1 Tetratricopeptide repeat-containing protein [Lutibacter agarilyticus]